MKFVQSVVVDGGGGGGANTGMLWYGMVVVVGLIHNWRQLFSPESEPNAFQWNTLLLNWHWNWQGLKYTPHLNIEWNCN